jgi:hypothetical protein
MNTTRQAARQSRNADRHVIHRTHNEVSIARARRPRFHSNTNHYTNTRSDGYTARSLDPALRRRNQQRREELILVFVELRPLTEVDDVSASGSSEYIFSDARAPPSTARRAHTATRSMRHDDSPRTTKQLQYRCAQREARPAPEVHR